MQECPLDLPNELFRFTNYTEILHNHDSNLNSNTFPDAQSLEENERSNFTSNLRLAASCFEFGIGIEVWALQKAWPGICDELWWFNFVHPNILHPATIASINAMLRSEDTRDRRFDCPVFVAESQHGWPRTCNNVKSPNMAEVRRHLTARAGRGYATQLLFLELCPTCNEDFIDRDVFQSRHGYKGELCNTRRPQRRGSSARVQWELLYRQVEAAMAVQQLSAQQVDASSATSQVDRGLQSLASHDPCEQHTPQPTNNHHDQAVPYLTPYQLIFDSESDEGERSENHNTSLSSPSGLELLVLNTASAPRPESQSDSSYNAQCLFPSQHSNQEANRTSNSTSPVQSQSWIRQLGIPMLSAYSYIGRDSSYAVARPCSMEVDGTDHTALMTNSQTPISDYGQEFDHQSLRRSDQCSYNAHAHSPFPLHNTRRTIADSVYCPPSLSRETHQDIASFHVNIEHTATPPSELNRCIFPTHSECEHTMHTGPRSSTPNIEANTPEPEDLPELHCDVEGCNASFSGMYRKGNLGRHRRQKHAGLKVYDCEDEACDRDFSRQDARLKHYRTSHPELASLHMPHKIDTTIRCTADGCTKTFRRPGDYRRHMRKHQDPKFKCIVQECGMTFYRMDKLRDHIRHGHKMFL